MAYAATAPAPEIRSLAGNPQQTWTDSVIRLSPPERYRLLVAVVLTIAYVVLLAGMLYASTGKADLGASIERDGTGQWRIASVVPSGLSYDQGVRPGDIIVSVVGSHGTAVDLNGDLRLNGAESLEVENPSSGELVSVTTGSENGGNALHRWGYAFLGLIFIGVGGPVFIKARQRPAALAFYVFCICTAVALAITIASDLRFGWALALGYISLICWAASFALFFFNFPVRIGRTPVRRALLSSGVIVTGMAVIGAYLWVLTGGIEAYYQVRLLAYMYMFACAGAGLLSLVRAAVSEPSGEVRQQLVLLIGGTALAIGPTLLLAVLPGLLMKRVMIQPTTTALALVIMPLVFAYAITQHQLLGIQHFVRRSAVYVVMGFFVLLMLSLSAGILGLLMPNGWQNEEAGVMTLGLVVFLIALSYAYLQRRVERLVDRFIYHDAYDYKEALLEFSAHLAAEQNVSVLAHQLVERTCKLMNLGCGVLLLAAHPDGTGTTPVGRAREDREATGNENEYQSLRNHTRRALHSKSRQALADHEPGRMQLPDMSLEALLYAEERARIGQVVGKDIHNSGIYLEPYARYGECAGWLVSGLQAELARLGIQLHHPDAPMRMIHVHTRSHETGAIATGSTNANLQHTSGNLVGGNYLDQQPPASTTFLGLPLWTRAHFVGMLCLGGKRTGEHFTKDDLALLGTLGSQAALAIYNAQLYEAREQALLDTITALAHAIEAKDNYTINHCENITGRAVALAELLALPRQEIENIRLGSILHDVGKIGVPDAILNKPGKLTAEEYEIIKQHAAIGARIVQSVGALQGVVPIVRHHQEKYDGSGYPDGLSGDQIPVGARIISVVDAYGAMTENRIYRKAPGHHFAIAELRRFAGKQFDPAIVEAFIRLLNEQPELTDI